MKKFFVIVLLLVSYTAFAHGVGYYINTDRSYSVKLYYSGGDELKYAEVSVFSPSNKDIPYQEGYADASGTFAFTPNEDGVWVLKAADGMGHAIEVEIEHKGDETDVIFAQQEDNTLLKAILGLSLLGNIGLVFYKRRK